MSAIHRQLLVLAVALPALTLAASPASTHWGQWRGPLGTGEAPGGNPPVEWSETKNVRFKVKIPGNGLSTPAVWGERIFLTTAVPVAEIAPPPPPAEGGRMPNVNPTGPVRFMVMALDRKTGKVIWEKTAREAVPHEGTHGDGSWAAASPVTDGEWLFAQFGSNGLYAYDLDGNLKWSKDLGDMTTRNAFGEGSSPVLSGDTLVVNWDHEGEDFVVALDKKNGVERWRQPRNEPTTWATPLVVEHGGKEQIIVPGTERTKSYDLASGELLWQAPGLTLNVIPSPVASEGLVFVMSGFRGNALNAIRLNEARGEISGAPAIAWSFNQDTPYVPSPLLYEGSLFFFKGKSNVLSVLDAKSGAVKLGATRLETLDGVYASPVGAAGRVYLVGRNGAVEVRRAAAPTELLATNKLDDRFDASPVVVGEELLLRGLSHLYLIAAAPSPACH